MGAPTESSDEKLARYQFLIAETPVQLKPDLVDVSTSRLTIHIHKFWPVVQIIDARGERVAVLFGTAVDHHKSNILRGAITWQTPEDGNLQTAFERFLYEFSGSWTCVVDYRGLKAVYCDGGASISCLFSPERRVVAAAACQIYPADELADRHHQVDENFYGADSFFVAGLTAYDGISRLLINFRLNLFTWNQERIWQAGVDRRVDWDAPEYARFIARRVHSTIGTLAKNGSVAMTLTAGQDSRILLSLVRDIKDEVQFYTLAYPASATDVSTATSLAERFGLTHQLIHPIRRDRADMALWRQRTSASVGGVQSRYVAPTLPTTYVINGLFGEMARSYVHESTDASFPSLTAHDVLDRLRLSATPRNLKAVDCWLESLWERNQVAVLDASQLELRYGLWASTQIVARDSPALLISPIADRAVISAMMSLPLASRKAHELTNLIVKEYWPELFTVPINQSSAYDWAKSTVIKLFNIPILLQKLHYEYNGLARRLRIRIGRK